MIIYKGILIYNPEKRANQKNEKEWQHSLGEKYLNEIGVKIENHNLYTGKFNCILNEEQLEKVQQMYNGDTLFKCELELIYIRKECGIVDRILKYDEKYKISKINYCDPNYRKWDYRCGECGTIGQETNIFDYDTNEPFLVGDIVDSFSITDFGNFIKQPQKILVLNTSDIQCFGWCELNQSYTSKHKTYKTWKGYVNPQCKVWPYCHFNHDNFDRIAFMRSDLNDKITVETYLKNYIPYHYTY